MMFEQEKTEAVMNLQEQHLKEMKGLIHDFEAQLNGLQLLARENKSEAFKKSIEEVRESIQERNDFYFVESKALQLILNQTNELCIKYGIEFCADIRYGNFLFMTFPDVFSLFENALCNAVNACLQLGEEEKKRIELRVFRQHEQIVVLLANTYNKANTRSNTYIQDVRNTEPARHCKKDDWLVTKSSLRVQTDCFHILELWMQWEPLIHVPIFRLILGIPFFQFVLWKLLGSWILKRI